MTAEEVRSLIMMLAHYFLIILIGRLLCSKPTMLYCLVVARELLGLEGQVWSSEVLGSRVTTN